MIVVIRFAHQFSRVVVTRFTYGNYAATLVPNARHRRPAVAGLRMALSDTRRCNAYLITMEKQG